MEARPYGLPRTAWIAAALFVLLLLPRIDSGTLWHHDELLTANRARELLVRGDPWAVTLNFAPSVKKPPLQFWICALLLRALPGHPELAVRLPTLLAGAACLLAAAWLARVSFPAQGGSLATWTVLLLAGCGYLIHASRIALLDPGAALLFTLALVGWQLARSDPRWWWFVAGQCVLGAWQKMPYGLAAWALLLVVERFFGSPAAAETNSATAAHGFRWPYHLPAAFTLTVLGALGWWGIEWLRENHAVLALAGYEQTRMFLRPHDPSDPGFRPWVYWGWLVRDWVLAGISAPVAAVAALTAGRRERTFGELGLVCVVYGGVTACLIYRSERYLVVIAPLLALLIVYWLQRVSQRLPLAARPWLLPVVFASTLPVAAFHYFRTSPARPDLLAIARELGQTLVPGERIFVTTDAESGFDPPEFVLFYADLKRPLEEVSFQALENLPSNAGSCRGVCSRTQWEALSQLQPTLQLVAERGDWVLWKRVRAD